MTLGSLQTFDQREILKIFELCLSVCLIHLSYVRLFVRPSLAFTIATERNEQTTSKFTNRLILAIDQLALKMGYIDPQGPVPRI